MDQRTRRQFVQTIETFFPRELCGEIEGYPTFPTSTENIKSGLTSDFVCGPLKDAVESGEHIIKCVQMPHIQCKCYYEYKKITYVHSGFYVMLSNKNQIVIYYPGAYHWIDMRSTTSRSWGRSGYDTKWMFLKLEGTEENVKRVIDFQIQEYMEKCEKSMEVIGPQISPSLQRAVTFHLALTGAGNSTCSSQPTLLHIMGYEAFVQSCTSLLRFMNSTVPQQQRMVRQRQRVVKQSSDRIERSMEKIRQEFRRLETEMKTLGELSSTLSTQRTFTVGQDGQFVSRPT